MTTTSAPEMTTAGRGRGAAAAASTANQRISQELLRFGRLDPAAVLQEINSSAAGLTEAEAAQRLERFGDNTVAHERPPHWSVQLLSTLRNPFILILIGLAVILFATDDLEGTITITTMVVVSVLLRFWQEFRSSRAAEALGGPT